jgi:MraZ protein
LKDHAQIGEEVAFVGLGTMFQMWEPGRFNRHRAEARERSRRGGVTLPSPGGPR